MTVKRVQNPRPGETRQNKSHLRDIARHSSYGRKVFYAEMLENVQGEENCPMLRERET